ncbi:MAG: aminotransferase class I/II-fold pyridoxal phosphate-dependent enzyme, partial [Clostridiales bacterium]|nr:aminotransferase class I/II-fold pyridoxal phosphate-dependent enzyme [Clostridiales bacterium]
WAVSTLAQAAGLAALTEKAYLWRSRALISEERAFLSAGLTAAGFTVLGGEANFLFFYSDISDLAALLRARGLLIRDCANYTGLRQGFYRVAVKSRADNMRLLEAMQTISDDIHE